MSTQAQDPVLAFVRKNWKSLAVGAAAFVVGLYLNGWGNPIGAGFIGAGAFLAAKAFVWKT